MQAGYINVKRYQLGMPVWRALGNTVQTDLAGFLYIFRRDRTALFVDARTPEEFQSRTVRCAVNIQAGEATAANDDGRLPNWDKGTRVVVFANSASDARKVAAEDRQEGLLEQQLFRRLAARAEAESAAATRISRIRTTSPWPGMTGRAHSRSGRPASSRG